jgi:glycosyltransferase involved in cell wall biosynthesis
MKMQQEEPMKPYLSVIIPAYNEEKRLGQTLTAVYTYLAAQPFTWELLIVLDGVTDNTAGVVAQFADGKDNIRWIDRQENMGKGPPCARACRPPAATFASSPTPTTPPT